MHLITRARRLKWRLLDAMRFAEGTSANAGDQWGAQLDALGLRVEFLTKMPAKADQGLAQLDEVMLNQRFERWNDQLARILDGSGHTVSWGWMTQRPQFYISETGLWLRTRGRYVMYDFHTPLEHRRNGYHSLLLHAAFANLPDEATGMIFALSDNIPPHKTYRRLGLTPVSKSSLIFRGDLRPGPRDRYATLGYQQ